MPALRSTLLFARMALFASAVPWLFRLPVRRLQRLVDAPFPEVAADDGEVDRILRYTAKICRAARPLISHPCQVRGLTHYYFLRRAGVDVSLVFGVGTVKDAFAGHCWLVRDGQPFLETTDPRDHFTQMYAFHGPGSTAEQMAAPQAAGYGK